MGTSCARNFSYSFVPIVLKQHVRVDVFLLLFVLCCFVVVFFFLGGGGVGGGGGGCLCFFSWYENVHLVWI